MGKHFWARRVDDDSSKKQPSWAWGLVHALGYHNWRFNIKKIIKYHKHSSRTHDHSGNWNPFDDDHVTIGLLDESEKLLQLSPKTSPATKKQSIRARIKAWTSRSEDEASGSSFSQTGRDGKHPVIFVHRSVDDCVKQPEDKTGLNVLEIFKIDKELLEKHMQDADEGIASFSCSALRSNSKLKLDKSRSFPVARFPEGVKVKPVTLENKQKDVWLVPREDKTRASKPGFLQSSGNDRGGATISINDSRKTVHRRCFSLNESVEKYTRLLENMNIPEDFKLNSSRSLRLGNENAHAHLSFRQKFPEPNADFYGSNLSSEIFDEDLSQEALNPAANGSSSAPRSIEEDRIFGAVMDDEENLAAPPQSQVPANSDKEGVRENDPVVSYEAGDRGVTNNEFSVPELLIESDSDEANSISAALQILLDTFFSCPTASSSKVNGSENYKACGAEENSRNYTKIQKKISDLEYVRQALHLSGMAKDPLAISWYSSDQPLSYQLFDELEARWCHESQDKESPDICGCWHHQMMFDLVNEMLLDVYDISAPYYPKPLFSSCHVRPFPYGEHMVEEVCTRAERLLDLKPEEKQSMNGMLSLDQSRNRRWMNLQMDAESVALGLEDMVFHQLLEELVL